MRSHAVHDPRSRSTDRPPGLALIKPSLLTRLLDEVMVVDVRPEAAATAEPCPCGTLNVPLDRLEAASSTWPPDLPIVTVSRSGLRAGVGTLLLQDLGFDQVAALGGSMAELRSALGRRTWSPAEPLAVAEP